MGDTDTDYFASLRGEKHMSLATFRRSGEPVPTPIWFAEVGGRLYVRTAAHFKKLERITDDSSVTVAPCTETGEVTGASLAGRARILDSGDEAIEGANAAMLDIDFGTFRPWLPWLRFPLHRHSTQDLFRWVR